VSSNQGWKIPKNSPSDWSNKWGLDSPYDYWSLGNKYKIKLNLNNKEVKLLNRLHKPNNKFFNIEFCGLEIIKLYLSIIRLLPKKFDEEGTIFDEQIAIMADLVARKQFRYRLNSHNYKYCIESFTAEVHSNIFKRCENSVREYYGNKNKLNADAYFTNSEVKTNAGKFCWKSRRVKKIL
jgi:hypothetical protein